LDLHISKELRLGSAWIAGHGGQLARPSLTKLQTASEKRIWKLLILNGSDTRVYPPPAFCAKSAQVIENKRRAREKERKERKRVCKLLRSKELSDFVGVALELLRKARRRVTGASESLRLWKDARGKRVAAAGREDHDSGTPLHGKNGWNFL
jgi:hypothetical protein